MSRSQHETRIRPGNPHSEWSPLMGVEGGSTSLPVTQGDIDLMRVLVDTVRAGRTGMKVRPMRRGCRGVKMTIEKARELRGMYAKGGYSHRSLGRVFGISGNVTKRILDGVMWRENT